MGVRLGVAILTTGTRPVALSALLASVAAQTVPAHRVVVVGNGRRFRTMLSGSENLGVSRGRNVALDHLTNVDVVIDLDDDGLLVTDDVFARIAAGHEADPRLGILSFRIADETGHTQRRHVPRLRVDDPMRGGPVTTFLGGGHILSRQMLGEVGGWPGRYFFTHSSSPTRRRTWRGGPWARAGVWCTCRTLLLQHPRTSPARHSFFYRVTARNRVWLARHLPAPLVPVYLGVWTALTVARTRDRAGLCAWLAGHVRPAAREFGRLRRAATQVWSAGCGPAVPGGGGPRSPR